MSLMRSPRMRRCCTRSSAWSWYATSMDPVASAQESVCRPASTPCRGIDRCGQVVEPGLAGSQLEEIDLRRFLLELHEMEVYFVLQGDLFRRKVDHAQVQDGVGHDVLDRHRWHIALQVHEISVAPEPPAYLMHHPGAFVATVRQQAAGVRGGYGHCTMSDAQVGLGQRQRGVLHASVRCEDAHVGRVESPIPSATDGLPPLSSRRRSRLRPPCTMPSSSPHVTSSGFMKLCPEAS